MLDALTPLAVSIQASRGAYALLLGSGVSRSAGIPTGYEVVLDLVRRVARLEVAEDPADPAAWYLDRFGKPAEYSDLLGTLAQTPAERSDLLRAYFEPSDAERGEGLKTPTAAHRAIARLAKEGWVQLILTTNFDRLMESALAEVDVRPVVIDSSDDIAGAPPIGRASCTLVKLHGDYLDTRIRNTESELAAYDGPMNALLDRVLDEYGLIVVGWSGDYDGALRDALARSTQRRYSTFWLARGELGDEANKLVACRRAQVISGLDADQFFTKLLDGVHALDDLARGAPVSVRTAVATAKRLLPRAEERIRLSDLLQDAVVRTRAATSASVDVRSPYGFEEYQRALREIEEASAIPAALMAVGCRWGDELHMPLWRQTLQRLADWPTATGTTGWLYLRRYPAALALYAGGLGAIAEGRLGTVAALLLTPVEVEDKEQLAALALALDGVLDDGQMQHQRQVASGNPTSRFYTPASDHVHDLLRPLLSDLIPNDGTYGEVFDRFEFLMSLALAESSGGRILLGGRWTWRHHGGLSGPSASEFVLKELERRGDGSDLVTGGLIQSAKRGVELVTTLRSQVRPF